MVFAEEGISTVITLSEKLLEDVVTVDVVVVGGSTTVIDWVMVVVTMLFVVVAVGVSVVGREFVVVVGRVCPVVEDSGAAGTGRDETTKMQDMEARYVLSRRRRTIDLSACARILCMDE